MTIFTFLFFYLWTWHISPVIFWKRLHNNIAEKCRRLRDFDNSVSEEFRKTRENNNRIEKLSISQFEEFYVNKKHGFWSRYSFEISRYKFWKVSSYLVQLKEKKWKIEEHEDWRRKKAEENEAKKNRCQNLQENEGETWS